MTLRQHTEPVIGMGATRLMFSDRHPATIVEVQKSATGKIKAVVIQEDTWKVVKGSMQDGSADYEFTPNPEAARITYTLRKNGRYVYAGSDLHTGESIAIGWREKYYDPSF
jgi:hypothetical protein